MCNFYGPPAEMTASIPPTSDVLSSHNWKRPLFGPLADVNRKCGRFPEGSVVLQSSEQLLKCKVDSRLSWYCQIKTRKIV